MVNMWYSAKARRTNALEYLRTLSFHRIFNMLKLLTGYYTSRIARRPVMWGMPLALSTEPSGHCQLKCPECPTGAGTLNRVKGTMTPQIFQKALDDSAPGLMYLNLFFQGEPLLNLHIAKMVKSARTHNIYTTISTNGLLLHATICEALVTAGLSRVLISLDGITQETYQKYRKGGDVDIVKEGIQRLLAAREKMNADLPLVVVQFLAFEHNQHELPAIQDWCSQTGVDKLEIKTAQIGGLAGTTIRPPREKRWSRYKGETNGRFELKNRMRNHCWRQWSSAVVAWNGAVAPCCYDKNLEHSPGTINGQSLKAIWQEEALTEYRRQILKDKHQIHICHSCPEGRKFWI